jgi:type IV secretory pathway TrbL component
MHSLSFFGNPQPTNVSETQLLNLMSSYKLELGAGFAPTMSDLMTSFSISLSLFLLFGGILNLFLLRSKIAVETMKGIILINLLFFGLCFLAMFFLTFLIPIICLGLIVLALILAAVTLPKKKI